LVVGQQVMSGSEAPIKSGNTLPLRNIPVGSTVHCIELMPGKGAQIARAAGTSVQLLAREGSYAQLGSAPAKFVGCTSNAVQPLAKSATKRTTCASLAKPVQPLAWHSSDRSRYCDEPDRSPARWW
jgi:hypothetical protein